MNMWWQSKRTQRGGAEAGIPLLLPASPWDGPAGTGWMPSLAP
jgi:hypothetical protein